MKKTVLKLRLHRETVRRLQHADLEAVQGGRCVAGDSSSMSMMLLDQTKPAVMPQCGDLGASC